MCVSNMKTIDFGTEVPIHAMTVREFAAISALQGLFWSDEVDDIDKTVEKAVYAADRLLKKLNEGDSHAE